MTSKSIKVDAFETVYIGGGTPSLWKEDLVEHLEKLFSKFGLSLGDNCEFTVESNPDSINQEVIQKWQQFGVNRLSVGVQSLDSTLFKYLDRVHTLDDSYRALEVLKNNSVNYTADLMIGLPRPAGYKRDLKREIEEILSYGVAHMSLYILKVNQGYRYFEMLPSEEEIEDEYFELVDVLAKNGFSQYEVSNFSKPNFESRHNKKYWSLDSVLALGPSATGYFASEKMRYKWKTDKNIFVEENLTSDEEHLEKIYLNLRTNSGISVEELESRSTQVDSVKRLLNLWESRGVAQVNGGKVHLNQKGFLLMDSLMDELFSNKIL